MLVAFDGRPDRKARKPRVPSGLAETSRRVGAQAKRNGLAFSIGGTSTCRDINFFTYASSGMRGERNAGMCQRGGQEVLGTCPQTRGLLHWRSSHLLTVPRRLLSGPCLLR